MVAAPGSIWLSARHVLTGETCSVFVQVLRRGKDVAFQGKHMEQLWMQARRSEEARVEEGQSGIERRKLYRIYTETILTKWNINYKLHSSGYWKTLWDTVGKKRNTGHAPEGQSWQPWILGLGMSGDIVAGYEKKVIGTLLLPPSHVRFWAKRLAIITLW